ncbi:MAG: hypothetical protein Q9218_002821 [Villophora microphyllina]
MNLLSGAIGNLIDEPSLVRYLKANAIDYESITKLSGGTANYVFLITTQTGERRIVKHAEPYVRASNGTIPFKVERMDFEATAIAKVGTLMQDFEHVKVPDIIKYDKKPKVLLMPYAGARTLKEAYNDPTVDIPELGRRLGEWLATLHHSTKTTSIGEGGNPTARAIYRWAYSHLSQVAEKYGLDVEFSKRVNDEYGSLLQTDDDCVCHGDFWPGNVLLDDGHVMTVVDWEMCRRGCGATDVGQFSAEAYLLDRFCGGRNLQVAFLSGYWDKMQAYGEDYETDSQYPQRVLVHTGVHLAFWPASVKWAEEMETKAVLEHGYQLIRFATGVGYSSRIREIRLKYLQ